MKKSYQSPSVDVVMFEYRDQVVVASGCDTIGGRTGYLSEGCKEDPYVDPKR